mgnify:CR=1 FL=1
MPEQLARGAVVYTPKPGAVTAIAASPWAPLVAVAGQRQVVLYHSDSSELLGVLLFTPTFVNRLLELGYNDAHAQRDKLEEVLA